MKKRNQVLNVLLFCAAILFGMFAAKTDAQAANKKNDKYEYKVKNEEVTIVKYLGNEANIMVPSKIDGKPVTTIEEMAFIDLDVKTICFPYTVTTFNGVPIWSCKRLTGVIVGSGVKEINDSLTALCSNTKYIVLGKNTKKLSDELGYAGGSKKLIISVPNKNAVSNGIYWFISSSTFFVLDGESPLAKTLKEDNSAKQLRTDDGYVNITFMSGDTIKTVANRVRKDTVVNDLFSLNDTSKKQFVGWYTSPDFKTIVTKIEDAAGQDITLYARFEDNLAAPEVTVKKVNDKQYKLSWKKEKGYYYQVELKYAKYRINSFDVIQKYKADLGSYTANVSGSFDCIFRVVAYKIVDGVKVYSEYSKESYSSKPVYPDVYIYDYDLDMNYVGGVDNTILFFNNSSKKIKYITFTVTGYNAVDDKATCRMSHRSSFQLQLVGPIEANDLGGGTWDAVWYNSTTDYAKLTQATIEYMDGSKKTVKLNAKGKF